MEISLVIYIHHLKIHDHLQQIQVLVDQQLASPLVKED
jgi:hypothetical protein